MKTLSIIVGVVCMYLLGVMTGYTAGYNDNFAKEVVKYRMTMKRR